MKELSRRDFLKLCAGSAAAVSLSQALLPELARAVPAAGNPPVLWIQGASCTGCSISLLNSVQPDILKILTEVISLKFHPNVSAAAGELAMRVIEETEAAGNYYLVVEGAVPTKDGGIYCTVGERDGKHLTFLDRVKELGENAAAVLAVGTCAAYGGIPAADPNPTGCKGVQDVFKEEGINTPVLNISGCPPHPDWIVGSLAHVLLFGELPEVDKLGRPKVFYGKLVHDNCPRRQYFDNSKFAKSFSEPGCLLEIGCKGPQAHCDSFDRQWNGGVSWCLKAGAPCIACTEKGFPDDATPFYARMPGVPLPNITASADAVGAVLGAAVVAGIGAHLVGNIATGRLGGK
ncbi:MAG: hydrogenase small subunit [Bacillota bacterium]|nr:hydrogenase small subunit [Bacillota bacterium]